MPAIAPGARPLLESEERAEAEEGGIEGTGTGDGVAGEGDTVGADGGDGERGGGTAPG